MKLPTAAKAKKQPLADKASKRRAKASESKPQPKRTAPKVAAAAEAQSAVERLRQRQAKREAQQQRTEQARQQAAAQRVATLRSHLADQAHPGGEEYAGGRIQQIRLQSYQAYVREKIIDAWIIPLPPQERRGLQATAFLLVRRDGTVEHVHLVQSSKNQLFDASLLQAIRRVTPLPELPQEYPGELLEVEMRFSDRES
jgi:TolA protein